MRIKYARTVRFSKTFYLTGGTFKTQRLNGILIKLSKINIYEYFHDGKWALKGVNAD